MFQQSNVIVELLTIKEHECPASYGQASGLGQGGSNESNHDCNHHSGGHCNCNQLTAPANLVQPWNHEPLAREEEAENNETLTNTW